MFSKLKLEFCLMILWITVWSRIFINQECASGMHCFSGFLSDVKGTVLKETVKLPARIPTRTSILDPLGI